MIMFFLISVITWLSEVKIDQGKLQKATTLWKYLKNACYSSNGVNSTGFLVLQNSHSLQSKILSSLKARQGTLRKSATNKVTDVEGQLLEMNIVVKDRTLPMSLEDIRITEERQCYESVMRRNKKIAHRIDRISRILFPIAFASYTLGYWLSYS